MTTGGLGVIGVAGRVFRSVQPFEDLADRAAINAQFPGDTPLRPATSEEYFDGVDFCHAEVIGSGS